MRCRYGASQKIKKTFGANGVLPNPSVPVRLVGAAVDEAEIHAIKVNAVAPQQKFGILFQTLVCCIHTMHFETNRGAIKIHNFGTSVIKSVSIH